MCALVRVVAFAEGNMGESLRKLHATFDLAVLQAITVLQAISVHL